MHFPIFPTITIICLEPWTQWKLEIETSTATTQEPSSPFL